MEAVFFFFYCCLPAATLIVWSFDKLLTWWQKDLTHRLIEHGRQLPNNSTKADSKNETN